MNNEHFVASIPDYLDGRLNKDEHRAFEQHLKDCPSCALELEEYKALLSAFENEETSIPSKKVKDNFLRLLEEEKNSLVKVVAIDTAKTGSNKSWLPRLIKIAASVALLIAAFSSGRYFQSEKANATIAQIENESLQIKQTAMLSLMENQSASKRIQGVQYIQDFDKLDTAIVNALMDRMLHDENTNVRLTAVEALSKFVNSELVKTAFITALSTEKDPSVQIAIIQQMVKSQEKKAVAPMKRLLEEEDTQPFVKDEINQVLSEII